MTVRPAILCALVWCVACKDPPVDAPDSGTATAVDAGTADAAVMDAAVPEVSMHVERLITLGSSSTAGSGASSVTTRYVNLLAAALGAQLHNLGTGGQTVEQVMGNQLPATLAILDGGVASDGGVDVVTFLPFTDVQQKTAQQLVDGYRPVLTSLAATRAWVVMGVPTVDAQYGCGSVGPLRGPNGECYPLSLIQEYAAKQQAMTQLVEQFGNASVALVPQLQAQRPETLAADGHPNDEGHAFLAACFVHAIAGRLGQDAGPPPYP